MSTIIAVKGATYRPVSITWNPVLDLTGATLTGIIEDENGRQRNIEGSLGITSPATDGVFTWDFHANDVANAGPHLVKFTATFSGEKEISYWTDFEVKP